MLKKVIALTLRIIFFYCAGGKGCITLKMACDGIYDCFDKSDGIVCDGLMEISCKKPLPFPSILYSVRITPGI